MYDFQWDRKTGGYKLLTRTAKYVASEIRPVYAEELILLDHDRILQFDSDEKNPILWARQNTYVYRGQDIGRCIIDENGQRRIEFADGVKSVKLIPVDVESMVLANHDIMASLVADTLKRINEMYAAYRKKCDIVYIGFSGGKDSMLLLDLCHRVLPQTVPVVFSDTDMELPDTYRVWEEVKARYPEREFIRVKANRSALDNWELFGPPSQRLRWCCAVHKSTPAIQHLRKLAHVANAKTCAFIGVRSEESIRRSTYDDISEGLKNSNQINAMPILSWGSHELFLYSLSQDLIINPAYKKGLPRVGCLLCPMSGDRQARLIAELYPNAVRPFADAIKKTIAREFASEADIEKFILEGGWHARQSGVTLKSVIAEVSEKKSGSDIAYTFDAVSKKVLVEWLKTLGSLKEGENERYEFSVKGKVLHLGLEGEDDRTIKMIVCGETPTDLKSLAKFFKSSIHKALACSECQVCASECPTGAITFDNGVRINTDRCIHCLKCHSMQGGCVRFFSRRYAGGTTMNISGINKYMTFGLKQEWIDVLLDEGENFRATTSLGNRMIPSAVTWFREAGLIENSTAIKPSKLLEIARQNGSDSALLWNLIWIGLANRSPLIKWFVGAVKSGERRTTDELNTILSEQVSSETVRKGALQSLMGIIKNSPIGECDPAMVSLEKKGARVMALTRNSTQVEPLAILYSLYVMAEVSGRSSFTLGGMMEMDAETPFVSPIVAFGLDLERLKAQCTGIATRYPNFLSCSFILGLEEVKVFPDQKSSADVLGLILGE